MMTFTDTEYSERKRKTKKEAFLDEMEKIIPWGKWVGLIEPYYYKGKRGRPPRGIEPMLRMYLLQCWFNLSDEGTEDAIYDSYAFKKFSRLDFYEEQVPDATTLLKFRRLLETNKICEAIFNEMNALLEKAGLMMRGGTIVDATIIDAPTSTKNIKGERDGEMRQTKKGNKWRFGMKVHNGVDAGSGLVHTITATPANVHDICEAHKLLREDDDVVYGDSGYIGLEKREEMKSDERLSKVECRIVARPSSIKSKIKSGVNWDKKIESRKASMRCKVEHPYLIVKKQFGYSKVAYKGIAKNLNRIFMLFCCANLVKVIRAGRTQDFCLAAR